MLGAAAVLVGGCDHIGDEAGDGSPDSSVCGQTLLGPSGDVPLTYDVSSGATTINNGGPILMTLTDDCADGVGVQIPTGTATTVARATAKDGRTAGLVLQPLAARVDLTVTRPDGTTYPVVINDTDLASPSPTG